MARHLLWLVLLGVLAPLGLASATAAASAEERVGSLGIRLVDAPSDRRDDPRARTYVVDHVRPGTTISRRVEVVNHTDDVQDVALYAGPARIIGGSFVGRPRGEASELTDWTSVGRPSLRLAPGESARTVVTVAVPAEASAGERYGAVWASMETVDRAGITMVNRVGVRIYLSVGAGGEPATDFVIHGLTAGRTAEGLPLVTAEVENTGGRATDMSGELRLLDGPGSLQAGPFPAELGVTLAPGDSGTVEVLLDPRLPAGPWRAELTLGSGTVQREVTARITFPESGAAHFEVQQRDLGVWPYVAAGALVLAAGAVYGVRRTRLQPAPSNR